MNTRLRSNTRSRKCVWRRSGRRTTAGRRRDAALSQSGFTSAQHAMRWSAEFTRRTPTPTSQPWRDHGASVAARSGGSRRCGRGWTLGGSDGYTTQLVAKLCTWGGGFTQAIQRMHRALTKPSSWGLRPTLPCIACSRMRRSDRPRGHGIAERPLEPSSQRRSERMPSWPLPQLHVSKQTAPGRPANSPRTTQWMASTGRNRRLGGLAHAVHDRWATHPGQRSGAGVSVTRSVSMAVQPLVDAQVRHLIHLLSGQRAIRWCSTGPPRATGPCWRHTGPSTGGPHSAPPGTGA